MESMPFTPHPAAGTCQVLPFTIFFWGGVCSGVNGLFLDYYEKCLGVTLFQSHHAPAPEDQILG